MCSSPPCTHSRDNHRRWRQINTLGYKSGSIWGRTYKKKGIRGSTCASGEWNPKLNLRLKSLPFRWVATPILRFCWTLQLHAATDAAGPHNLRWDEETCAVKSDPQGDWDAQCNFDSLNQRETFSRQHVNIVVRRGKGNVHVRLWRYHNSWTIRRMHFCSHGSWQLITQ